MSFHKATSKGPHQDHHPHNTHHRLTSVEFEEVPPAYTSACPCRRPRKGPVQPPPFSLADPRPSPQSPSRPRSNGLWRRPNVEGPTSKPKGQSSLPMNVGRTELPINREAITKVILYSASPPSPPYDFSDHHRSLTGGLDDVPSALLTSLTVTL
ncbi:hypothetical protein Tco_0303271, partial [Tanacetum coccineum]